MGAFLGLVIPANNATVMAAVLASLRCDRWDGERGTRLGTAWGVAVAAMGLHVAELHNWVGPQVVLAGLAVSSIALAATTLSRPSTSGEQRVADGHELLISGHLNVSRRARNGIRLRCWEGGGAERGSALLAVLGALTWPVMVAQPPAAGTTKMQKGWPAGSA
jgi:hypothetical protein